jgi:hypothetical protein
MSSSTNAKKNAEPKHRIQMLLRGRLGRHQAQQLIDGFAIWRIKRNRVIQAQKRGH